MSEIRPDAPSTGPLGEEGAKRLLEQAFDLWITPEIDRRRDGGTLPEPFRLVAAQRLQWPDGRIEVRLNDEVQGVASMRAVRPIEAGERLSVSDLDGLESFDLLDAELDAGHWTVLWTGKNWFCGFNFLTSRAKCADLLDKAGQFTRAAADARERTHAAVVVDTLFSACELIAKAELITFQQLGPDTRTHGRIASQINHWRRTGNVEGAFVDLFNRLGQLRPRYRYDTTISEQMPVSDEDMALVEGMIERARRRAIGRVR